MGSSELPGSCVCRYAIGNSQLKKCRLVFDKSKGNLFKINLKLSEKYVATLNPLATNRKSIAVVCTCNPQP